jgi:hypothetical protein
MSLFVGGSIVFGEEKPKTELTPEMKEAVLKFVGVLNEHPPANNEPKKTPAEVADKALDMFGNVVGQLSAEMEKMAPEVWRIMVRQQYAKAFTTLAGPLAAMFFILIFMFIGGKVWKHDPSQAFWKGEREDTPTNRCVRLVCMRFIPILAITAIGATLASRLGESVGFLINPEYYALKDLLMLLRSST